MIKEITISELILVRSPVLRIGKPIESCHFDGDDLDSTVHFGFFEVANLIGIISIFKKDHIYFKQTQFQIRGMAVLVPHQKKGIGGKLVRFAEQYILGQQGNLIWLNARFSAIGFYEKLNYQIIGSSFQISDIGAHYVMFKNI
jgi:GNAT superfamily N-acetyltransferase